MEGTLDAILTPATEGQQVTYANMPRFAGGMIRLMLQTKQGMEQ